MGFSFSVPSILNKVTRKIQKAVASAGGFALVALGVTPVGKRVFLLIVPTITTVMHDMTPAATTVKKAALGRSKSPPLAVKKHSIESPSLAIPIGREFLLAVFGEIAVFFPIHHLGSSGLMIVGYINHQYVIYGVISFCTGEAGLFLPPTADFLYLLLFSLPSGRRGGVWRRISESSLSRYFPTHTDA